MASNKIKYNRKLKKGIILEKYNHCLSKYNSLFVKEIEDIS